ncbi:glycosyltransferase family 2 protein [Teredinibacter sp. KSP-S5-2]|uniref:glycosyltransferase family 2 protein n=1 Tax=Teredinibacter sp. KSP-S5-2 TaxID=3034506 RepID=UPI0029347AEA|nr:glycosyltransferase [Teredinibacter sp. KSP-S5-2]WNO08304.1 glycosyltransferase [Teredinibacter sp. KSP-S5-2]
MLSIIVSLVYIAIVGFKVLSARHYRENFPKNTAHCDRKKISIFQPILSGDPQLPQTLAANLTPLHGATFYWLVDEKDNEAQNIVDALIAQHPTANIITMCFPEPPEGINPKLFKVSQAFSACQSDYCVVLDDDTILPEESLNVLIQELTHYQLTTGLPRYQTGENFATKLLAAFVNNNSTTTYLSLLPFMPPITINGMCYAFEREWFKSIGGFEPLLPCLTDDLAVAEQVLANNGKIRQTPYNQIIATSLSGKKEYLQQMHRWYLFANILFFKQSIKNQTLILLLYALPPLLLLFVIANGFVAPSIFTTIPLLCTLSLRHILLNASNKTNGVISLVSELIQSLHMTHALISKKIRWRSRYYHVHSNRDFRNVQ